MLVVNNHPGCGPMIERVENRRGNQKVITLVQTGDGTQPQQRRLQPLQSNPQAFAANKIYQDAMRPYQKHWAELHRKLDPDPEWFAAWLICIPGRACNRCAKNFEEILQANPIRYDDYFRWSVEVHNAVNRKLSKPELTVEEAAGIWLRK